MTTKINTVRYSNDTIVKYERDKARMIKEGWIVFEENIQRKEVFLNGVLTGVFINGSIVYERKDKINP